MHFPFLYFSEIEAKEACDWLRAAGFPQYAQLYEGRLAFSSLFIKTINSKWAAHILWCILASKSFLSRFLLLSLSLFYFPLIAFAMPRAYPDANLEMSIASQAGFTFCSASHVALLSFLLPTFFFSSLYHQSQLCLFLLVFFHQQFFCSLFLFLFPCFSSLLSIWKYNKWLLINFLEITKLIVLRLFFSCVYLIWKFLRQNMDQMLLFWVLGKMLLLPASYFLSLMF